MTASLLGTCVAVILGALAVVRPQAESPPATPDQPLLEQPAPPFHFPDLSGKPLALEELGGRFTILHFGASW
jgi:cytochrome oxidase Cu insertion factor (SCO1/SenC/PrrC family)